MRIPATVYVLALGAFALITTELGAIGILPQVSDAFGDDVELRRLHRAADTAAEISGAVIR